MVNSKGRKKLVYTDKNGKESRCWLPSSTIYGLKEKGKESQRCLKPTHYFQERYDQVVVHYPDMIDDEIILICEIELNKLAEPYILTLIK